jgi:hypothetical protein
MAKPLFNKREAAVLQEMEEKLAPNFGVSLHNQNLVLRMEGGAVRLVIAEVSPGVMNPATCYTCGGVDQLKPAELVVIHANGDEQRMPIKTCTYCRLPQ